MLNLCCIEQESSQEYMHRTKGACPDLTKTLSLEVTIQSSNKDLLVVMV